MPEWKFQKASFLSMPGVSLTRWQRGGPTCLLEAMLGRMEGGIVVFVNGRDFPPANLLACG